MKKVGLMGLALSLMYSTSVSAADVQVRNIDVSGLQRVELETVLSYINIQKNESVSQEELDDALKRLYNTGLFADVVMDVSAGGNLNIRLIENPIVNKRVFDGNEKIDDAMLEKEVQLAPRSIFSKAKVQEDVQRILEIYKRAGRYAVVVDPKVIVRSENRVDLIYEIDEGPVASISKINFIGNTHYSDEDLQGEIMSKETRWFRIFSSKENYDAEKTNYDKELLRRFYLKHGYADFAVSSAASTVAMAAFALSIAGGTLGITAMAAALLLVNSSMKSISSNAKSAQKSITSMRTSLDVVNEGLDALGNKAKSAVNKLISIKQIDAEHLFVFV